MERVSHVEGETSLMGASAGQRGPFDPDRGERGKPANLRAWQHDAGCTRGRLLTSNTPSPYGGSAECMFLTEQEGSALAQSGAA